MTPIAPAGEIAPCRKPDSTCATASAMFTGTPYIMARRAISPGMVLDGAAMAGLDGPRVMRGSVKLAGRRRDGAAGPGAPGRVSGGSLDGPVVTGPRLGLGRGLGRGPPAFGGGMSW